MRKIVLLVAFVSACGGNGPQVSLQESSGDSDTSESAVADKRFLRTSNRVPGQYIVVLAGGDKTNTGFAASMLAANHQAVVGNVFGHALQGFSATMSEADARLLAREPAVAYVQESRSYKVLNVQESTLDLEENEAERALAAQTGVTWGLDRIDQASRPLDNTYTSANDGRGVSAYIVDTGIRTTHQDFGGRAVAGFSSINDGNGYNDCHGHGSHTAGTVGGTVFGVAKGITLYPVRVLDCAGSGDDASVIAGIDWVVQNAKLPAVANMSLGGDASQALDDAIRAAIAKGIVFAIAAGNDNKDACGYSPARTAEAITVGASTKGDWRAMFSNWGTCVDIFAPGKSITSVNGKSDMGSTTMSGTSMAAPHVCGAAALVLSANPALTPREVRDVLVNNAAVGKVGGLWGIGKGSPNTLLNVEFVGPTAL